jgi:N-carbamoylputrescine amidase
LKLETTMQSRIRASAISVDNHPDDDAGNLKRIGEWICVAAEAGGHLVVFPELSLTGFLPNHPTGNHEDWLRRALKVARRIAQPIPGPGVDSLIALSGQHQVLIAAGLLEDAGNLLYNTYVLVGPGGLLGQWRKMHVPMYEMPFYNGGQGPTVVQTELGRIGVNICFDAFLPESTRLLAVQNVDLVLFPFAADPPPGTAAAWADWARPALQARCSENGVFGVACNYVGTVENSGAEQAFPGGGLAIGPRGEILAEWTETNSKPGMLTVDLHAQELLATRASPEYFYRFRRPELYRPLAD